MKKITVLFIIFVFAFFTHAFSRLSCVYYWQNKLNKFQGTYVNINGKTYGGYDKAFTPSFSEDGVKWGFSYKSEGKWYASINGLIYGGYDDLLSPCYFCGRI